MFKNKIILITGGTGSVGKVLCAYFINQNIKQLIVYCRDEYKQFTMSNLPYYKNNDKIKFIIGNIKDIDSIKKASVNVDYIIHTAALKHVDICENNPIETININVKGSENIINAALENNVNKVLFISTDKATNPSNTYGTTKLLADKLCINANKYNKTKFSVIRFGNIFGSRGSLIESLFTNKSNKFILTNENIARVFISWKDLLNNILKCLNMMNGGEIFIPKSKSIYIRNLMYIIDKNLEIRIGELRDGEKLVEILLSPDDINNTISYNNMYIILSKWCEGNYITYEYIDNNTRYSSIDNEFYTDNEILKMIEELNKFNIKN